MMAIEGDIHESKMARAEIERLRKLNEEAAKRETEYQQAFSQQQETLSLHEKRVAQGAELRRGQEEAIARMEKQIEELHNQIARNEKEVATDLTKENVQLRAEMLYLRGQITEATKIINQTREKNAMDSHRLIAIDESKRRLNFAHGDEWDRAPRGRTSKAKQIITSDVEIQTTNRPRRFDVDNRIVKSIAPDIPIRRSDADTGSDYPRPDLSDNEDDDDAPPKPRPQLDLSGSSSAHLSYKPISAQQRYENAVAHFIRGEEDPDMYVREPEPGKYVFAVKAKTKGTPYKEPWVKDKENPVPKIHRDEQRDYFDSDSAFVYDSMQHGKKTTMHRDEAKLSSPTRTEYKGDEEDEWDRAVRDLQRGVEHHFDRDILGDSSPQKRKLVATSPGGRRLHATPVLQAVRDEVLYHNDLAQVLSPTLPFDQMSKEQKASQLHKTGMEEEDIYEPIPMQGPLTGIIPIRGEEEEPGPESEREEGVIYPDD
jgi:regulator of replication initiation timing